MRRRATQAFQEDGLQQMVSKSQGSPPSKKIDSEAPMVMPKCASISKGIQKQHKGVHKRAGRKQQIIPDER